MRFVSNFLNIQRPDAPHLNSSTSSDMNKKFDLVFLYCCKIVARRLAVSVGPLVAGRFTIWRIGLQKQSSWSFGQWD